MENASKALIMAGSILFALLVIGTVTLMYNQIASIQQTKSNAEEEAKFRNYSQKFEQYNKRIYGSELLSLANLQLDYNYRQADLKGYVQITINVQIKKGISENNKTYVPVGMQTVEAVKNGISKLEEDISYYENDSNGYVNKKERNKRSVKYYAQLSNRQIATLFEITYSSEETDYEIGDRLADSKQNPKTSNLLRDIELYKNLKTDYTEFKNTSFMCKSIQYDDNARVNAMNFVEEN